MTLFVHPDTQKALDAFLEDAPHALIMSGKRGVGLATIAADFAKKSNKILYTVLPEKDEKIDLEKGTITVQSIRRLYDITKTAEPNGRVIIIDYAERMTHSAQNAFLKLLEEPVEGTQFVLLTHDMGALLPTIISRSQHLMVKPVSLEASNTALDELKISDATKRTQLLFIASGLPAELHRLVAHQDAFDARVQIVKDAREYISGSSYARLKIALRYKNNRAGALVLLEDAVRMLHTSLIKDDAPKTIKTIEKMSKLHTRITEQGNVRLQLSDMA